MAPVMYCPVIGPEIGLAPEVEGFVVLPPFMVVVVTPPGPVTGLTLKTELLKEIPSPYPLLFHYKFDLKTDLK